MKKSVFLLLLLAGILLTTFAGNRSYPVLNNSGVTFLQTGPDDEPQFGKDSIKCVENLSLYREFFKQWKASKYTSNAIHDIIPPWRWVFNNCPKASKNTYIEGVSIMDYLISTAKNPDEKSKYIDTLMLLYDQRIKYFNQEGFVLGRKGMDMLKYRPDALESAYPVLKRSFDLELGNSDPAVLVYLFETTIKLANADKVEDAAIIDSYESVMPVIENNITTLAEKPEKQKEWTNIKEIFETAFQPYATCEVLVPLFEKKLAATPEDVELLKKIISTLDKKRCTDAPLYFDAIIRLNTLEPSATSSFFIAKGYLKMNEFEKAYPYLEKATEIEDPEKLSDVYLLMATYHREKNNLIKSREYAQKAIQNKASNGPAYILIGDLYASTASECGDNDLTKRVAFWAAVDMYSRAKQNDPSMAEDADKRIAIYARQFPTKETIFFYDLKNGDSYNVGCWINVNTIVRSSN